MSFRSCARPGPALCRLAALALLAATTGCASLQTVDASPPSVGVPDDWGGSAPPTTARPTELAAWWRHFADPALSALVERAVTANTDVRGAQAALAQARALRDVQAAARWPALDASASAQRSKSGGLAAGNQFRAGLDAGWEVDLFGARRSAIAATEADTETRAAQLGDVQVSVAAEVALAYLDLRAAQARLAIARDNLAAQLETQQITEWRVQAGLATSLELEQGRAATEQTRAQLPALQTLADQAVHALALLTGRPAAALRASLAAPAEGAPAIPQPATELTLAFPADTLRQRADVRAAEAQLRAAAARVLQAQAERLPRVQLAGSIGLSALTLGSLTGSGALVAALLADISMPLFDGGAGAATVRASAAVLEQQRAGYEAAVLGALRDVEDALVALRGDRERLARFSAAAEAAANAALLARQRHASGLVDFQTVLETQRTLLATQDSVASTRAAVGTDHVRLYKALGGGWQPDAPDSTAGRPGP